MQMLSIAVSLLWMWIEDFCPPPTPMSTSEPCVLGHISLWIVGSESTYSEVNFLPRALLHIRWMLPFGKASSSPAVPSWVLMTSYFVLHLCLASVAGLIIAQLNQFSKELVTGCSGNKANTSFQCIFQLANVNLEIHWRYFHFDTFVSIDWCHSIVT